MCAKPRAELVYLTDNNKIYLPRATLLHRCSDLTGCCTHATHSCQPSQVETVTLYFFTISVQSRIRQNQNIEKVSFQNHTECTCMPVDHSRSESLVKKNETNSIGNVRQATSFDGDSVISNDNSSNDDGRAAMYNGDITGGENSANNIDINNGMEGNEDSQNSVLKYWGKLLGLYKTKVYRNVDQAGESEVNRRPNNVSPFTSNQQPSIRRMDNLPPLTLPSQLVSPAPLGTVHYPGHLTLVPYQSQYMYLYPSANSQYKVMNHHNSNFAKRDIVNANSNYQLAYRRIH